MHIDLINLDRYPLHDPDNPRLKEAVAQARAALHHDGCAVVPDIVPPQALANLREEIVARLGAAHFSTQTVNPYFHTDRDITRPDRHPVNTFIERSSGFIAGDAWSPDGPMHRLFTSPELTRFIAECLEIDQLHPYADPLAGLTANILEPGQQFSWHFDTNDFAVTLLVDAADEGGLFQYVPGIRSANDEGFDAIQPVLEGGELLDGELGVKTLRLRPGDLQIFRGRYALHRVTRVGTASNPRYAAILAYTEEPGVIGRVARTRQLFGRVLPEHLEAERQRVRADALLD
jgi:hypothetical protein